MRLSVIVPAFDEAPRIASTVHDLHATLSAELGDAFEIVVVDDGSTDGTLEAALDVADVVPRCTVVSYPVNAGKGEALRRGLMSARGELVAFFDGDGDIAASSLLDLVRTLERSPDVSAVVGTRHWPTPRPWYRSVPSRLLARFARSVLELPVHETQAGAKVFVRADVARVLPACREQGFLFDLEVMARMREHGLGMASVDIVPVRIRRSRIGIATGLRELLPVLRIWRSVRPRRGFAVAAVPRPRTVPVRSRANDGAP